MWNVKHIEIDSPTHHMEMGFEYKWEAKELEDKMTMYLWPILEVADERPSMDKLKTLCKIFVSIITDSSIEFSDIEHTFKVKNAWLEFNNKFKKKARKFEDQLNEDTCDCPHCWHNHWEITEDELEDLIENEPSIKEAKEKVTQAMSEIQEDLLSMMWEWWIKKMITKLKSKLK